MNTIEIYLTSVGENQEYSQNFSFAELIKDFPVYQGNYQNIVLNINIPTSILPSGYAIAGVTTDTMGVAVKVNASSLAPNGMVRQSKSFYLRYIKTYTKNNVEYAMFQRPFPQTFSLYAGQGANAPKLTINVVNIMNDTLMEPNPTVVSLITSQTCSLEIMPSTILDKDAQLDPTDLEEINARLTSIEEEQLIQNTDIDTNEENIADLDLRVTANEDDIADIKEEIEGLGGTPFTNDALGLIKGSTDTGKISANDDGTGTVNGFSSLSSRVETNEGDIADIKLEQTTQNNDIGGLTTRMGTAEGDIDAIESKIPSQASSSNQLADKDFVNSSINALAAYYITKNAQGDPFATKAELNNATTFYSGGVVRVPTTNDYCIVLADESKQSSTGVAPTTRYSYQVNQWEYQYTINDTALTAAQLAALNSGMTSADKTKLDGIQSGAEVNVQADWNQTNSSADDYIKNKPTIPSGVIVDTTLDGTSNNAIANSAVTNEFANKMNKANPTGTGSFSLNRKANTLNADYSFTEGNSCEASGFASHAEGGLTSAKNGSAHAEGAQTLASGYTSHAQGLGTIAQRQSQHAMGEYNVADTTGSSTSARGEFVEIVGNGTDNNNRSNARTLDWSGNEKLAGWLTMNGSTKAVGYDPNGTSTTEQTLLDNYYTKSQVDAKDATLQNQLTPSAWTNATLNSTYISNGTCRYCTVGKIVIVQMYDIRFTQSAIDNFGSSGSLIAISGLPTGNGRLINLCSGGNNTIVPLSVNNGNATSWYTSPINTGYYFNANFTYIKED